MRRTVLFQTLAVLIVLTISACSPPPATDISLPVLFTDHMVLQRDMPITVWGWATPGGNVTASMNGSKATGRVASDGSWLLSLPSLEAGGPYTLTVSGAETFTFNDVLIGEVWIASGQSNMEWPLQSTNDAANEIAAANYGGIRIIMVDKNTAYAPQTTVGVEGWSAVTPESIPGFSAVAYFFGRKLFEELKVPIGLIGTYWGGTPAEAWTSAEALSSMPDFADRITALAAEAEEIGNATIAERRTAWLNELRDMDQGYQGNEARWAGADLDASGWESMDLPRLWEGAGLPGYDGVVWFRKSFDLPVDWTGRDLTLKLAMIDDSDSTWVNGVKVGSTAGYNAPRAYTIPASVLHAGTNSIAVRVMDTGGGGGIYGEAVNMSISNGSATRALAGNWKYAPGIAPGTDMPSPPSALQNEPAMLYNAMVAPLIPYTFRGAIWYQGESNAGRAYQYRTLFPAMIQDWRDKWDEGDFPFYWVQLANFMAPQQNPSEPETWPELREAQTMTLSLPNTAQAVILDIGEANDIHPRNKQDVGLRLALPALNQVYGLDVVYSGPSYRDMTIEGATIRLHFDHVGGGLVAHGGALKGFAIAGEDQKFVWADARIDGETVVLSSTGVSNPVAARYAWANNPVISLYNEEGLPASSFRSDDWKGVTDVE